VSGVGGARSFAATNPFGSSRDSAIVGVGSTAADEELARRLQDEEEEWFESERSGKPDSDIAHFSGADIIPKTASAGAWCFQCDAKSGVLTLSNCRHSFCVACMRDATLPLCCKLSTDGADLPFAMCPATGCDCGVAEQDIRLFAAAELEQAYEARSVALIKAMTGEDEEEAASREGSLVIASSADAGMPPSIADLPCEDVRESNSQAVKTIECPLCFETHALDNVVTFDCDHALCCACFVDFIADKVTDGRVADDELVCPIPDCKCGIRVEMIEAHLRPESVAFGVSGSASVQSDPLEQERRAKLWEKFLEFRLRLFEPEGGKRVQCPTPGCGWEVILDDDGGFEHIKEVTCAVCTHTFTAVN
jgi:hypothetical protein